MTNATWLTVRVQRKAVEALGISSFELVAEDSGVLPRFSAGSHIDVYLPAAPDGSAGQTRQYSLCNDPQRSDHYLIAVLRDPASRGGSSAMHASVVEGQRLQISAPRNHFALAPQASRHLLLAGGIGVTPLLCMAERLAVMGADFELHYCTRSLERTAFVDRIAQSGFAGQVQFHHDDGAVEQRLALPALLGQPRAGEHAYVCGPQGFMDAVLGQARAAGWPEAQLHFEYFGAAVLVSEGDCAFELQLASSGRRVLVAADQTVVQALAAAGVDLPTSCEQGVCGTCLTRVLAGQIDHRDQYLTPEEQAANDQFLPCCSRARSARLVLDL